ncbi:MAG TPA: DUF1684 domain-containing protein [Micrococcaceae bacterium]|jgi:hypothetical protein|nr:DUF1684 domain-containing protein [Micrococcaceae bacterium]
MAVDPTTGARTDQEDAAARAAEATAVADWRLQTFALYARVREEAATDPAAAHRTWCRRRNHLFRTHPASALNQAAKASFSGLAVSAYDPDFRFRCGLTTAGAGQEMAVRTGTDGTVPFVRLGTFEVPSLGPLAAWQLRGYGGGIFLPFRDTTAGKPDGSYGGGRYLLDTIKGAHLGADRNTFVLDFNFAYNPSCAYDEAWACPLPGKDNRLPVDVPVGELYLPSQET